jgi:hypothetical protein
MLVQYQPVRSFLAGLAIVLAFFTGTAALGAFVAHQVVLNPDHAGVALDAALDDRGLVDRVLARVVPGYNGLPQPLVDGVRRFALTPSVHRAARRVTFDPATGELSLRPVQSALASELRQNGAGPVADAITAGDAVITVPANDLARYNDARWATSQVALLGGLMTAALFVLALIVSPRRSSTLRSIGLTVLLGCGVVGAVFWAAPKLIGLASSSVAAQAAAVLSKAALPNALQLLIPFAVVGLVITVASLLIPGRKAT